MALNLKTSLFVNPQQVSQASVLPPNTFTLQGACLLYLAWCLGGQKETTGLPSLGRVSPGDQTSVLTHAPRMHQAFMLIGFLIVGLCIT